MRKEKTIKEKLADYGVRQFVRNRIVKVLLDSSKQGKPERVILNMNEDILREFTLIAKDESKKMFDELREKLKTK